jgi:hypothetical protein
MESTVGDKTKGDRFEYSQSRVTDRQFFDQLDHNIFHSYTRQFGMVDNEDNNARNTIVKNFYFQLTSTK